MIFFWPLTKEFFIPLDGADSCIRLRSQLARAAPSIKLFSFDISKFINFEMKNVVYF